MSFLTKEYPKSNLEPRYDGVEEGSMVHKVQKQVGTKTVPNFEFVYKDVSILGRLNYVEELDIVEIMAELPPSVAKLFRDIKRNYNYVTNESFIVIGSYTQSKKVELYRKLKILINRNIIRKMQKRDNGKIVGLIINPRIFVPPKEKFELAEYKWEQAIR